MNDWKVICRIEDIPRLGARKVTRRSGGDIAVFRTAEDKVFALLDKCPHKGGPLSQGIVFGESVAPVRCTTGRSAWPTAALPRRTSAAPSGSVCGWRAAASHSIWPSWRARPPPQPSPRKAGEGVRSVPSPACGEG